MADFASIFWKSEFLGFFLSLINLQFQNLQSFNQPMLFFFLEIAIKCNNIREEEEV